jgi:SAM-dependent methyltransferase
VNHTGSTPPTNRIGKQEMAVTDCGERFFGIGDVVDASGRFPPNPQTAGERLARAVAAHLSALRVPPHPQMQGGKDGPKVTTFAHEPTPVAGTVTIGHLVTVSVPLAKQLDLPRAGQECVIWEQVPAQDIPGWLGIPPPSVGPPSPQRLLLLKRAAREESLPDTPAGRALGDLFASGRYLSARLAYQYPNLMRSILDDLGPPAEPDAVRPDQGEPDRKTAPHRLAHRVALMTGASMNNNFSANSTSTDRPDASGVQGEAAGNTWTGSARNDLATSYARHVGSLRGALRQALVSRALFHHLPDDRPQRVLDVGAGTGQQGIALARAGHDVVLLDPDHAMLDAARNAVDREAPQVRARVRFVHGGGERAAELAGEEFDLVCCHGVLMYLPDPAPLIAALCRAVRVGGLISVLAKNGDALAMRPGIEGRWSDALDALTRPVETGRLGLASRADSLPTLARLLDKNNAPLVAWYGVRIFTDHLRDAPVAADFDRICDLEWAAGTRDPYRRVARLLHLVARKEQP